MWNNDFRHLYADYAGCDPADFEKRVFWRALYVHAVPVAWVINLVAPEFFRLDRETVDRVGQTFDAREYSRDLDRYRWLSQHSHSLLRSFFLVRISGKKLIRVRRQVERHLAASLETAAGSLQPTH